MVASSGSAGPEALSEVIARAERGEGEAFGEIYRRFSRRIFSLSLHLLGSREDAEDATSEVFLKVRGALGRYDHSVPFGAWAQSIAANHCLDRLRRRRREGRLFEPEPEAAGPVSPTASPLAELMADEQRSALARALEALPERYRLPLVLRYHAEMSYVDIAERLGTTREQVGITLFRGKERLRRALSGEGT
ncbi:MAG TPA: sigma-70 family RNA polymerase sigma factor [Vicinamibacteria bacterium]|nr:sigma-70 family RNA polymerase sigma factor [Vicinamibacteria bacterium]